MWPMLLDMSRDDCKRLLRRLELEAYASIVSALRAQGELSKEKRKILQDLCSTLKISMERHKAEIRRAVNDEKLTTVAEQMCGPNTMTEWAIEGRRLIPLLPRLVPQTAFTALANNVANIAAAENAKLPPHSHISKPKAHDVLSPGHEPSVPETAKSFQQSANSSISPNLLIAAQTSSSIPPERDEYTGTIKKQRRSSNESPISPALPLSKVKIPVTVHQHSVSRVTPPSQYPMNVNTIKITPCRSNSADSPSPSQKVIIVSSSSSLGGTGCASILQRSLSVPIVKTAQSGSTPTHLRGSSMVVQTQGNSVNPGIASSNLASLAAMASSVYTMSPKQKLPPAPVMLSQPSKLRPRIITPLAPQPPAKAVRATLQAAKPKYSYQMKDASGVKMMAIGSGAAKILPKPTYGPVGVGGPTSAGAPTPSPRAAPSGAAPRVITVHTSAQPGGTAAQRVHLGGAAAGVPRATLPKTNVIVVQKGATSGYARGVTLAHGLKEVSKKPALGNPSRVQMPTLMVKRQTSTLHAPVEPAAGSQLESSTPVTQSTNSNLLVLDLNQEQVNKTTALADIMQASGILLDEAAGSEGVELEDQGEQYFQPTSIEETRKLPSKEIKSMPEYLFQGQTKVPSMAADEGRVVSLEEALQMLGQADCAETRAILSQAGIEVTDQQSYNDNESEGTGVEQMLIEDASQQVAHEEDVIGAEETDDGEGIGELDPQTGIYSVSLTNEEGSEDIGHGIGVKSDSSARMDIFSTALASADINLDAFQFVDDNMGMPDSSVDTAIYLTEEPSSVAEELDIQQADMKMDVSSEENKAYADYLQPVDNEEDEKTAVMVEPSHMDTTDMYIEDFASQKM